MVQRLVILGDSVSAGYGLTAGQSFAHLLGQRVALADPSASLIVSALDGIDTGYALRRFDRMVTAHQPTGVLVVLGLNDALPPGKAQPITPAEYRRNLLSLLDRILSLGARATLASPNPRFVGRANETSRTEIMRPFVEQLLDVATGLGIPTVDLYRRFLEELNLAELLPDGVHPSARGHELIAEMLLPAVIDLLQPQKLGVPVEVHGAL